MNHDDGFDRITPQSNAFGDEYTDNTDRSASSDGGGESGRSAFEWVQALVCAVLAVILVFVFFVRMISVDGTSMLPTLQDNDRLLILSTIWCTPTNGDIIVLSKDTFMDSPIVKRIIATEGQTIDINFETGEVSVDGVVLDEPYINEPTNTAGDVQFPFTVDDGCVFVMGDNRNGSTDSRWTWLGEVDRRYIMGKAFAVVIPGRSAETGKFELSHIGLID